MLKKKQSAHGILLPELQNIISDPACSSHADAYLVPAQHSQPSSAHFLQGNSITGSKYPTLLVSPTASEHTRTRAPAHHCQVNLVDSTCFHMALLNGSLLFKTLVWHHAIHLPVCVCVCGGAWRETLKRTLRSFKMKGHIKSDGKMKLKNKSKIIRRQ